MRSLFFTDTQLEAIAAALGDTSSGLTGSEIGFLLSASRIADVDPSATKRVRLYNAFANDQNSIQDRLRVLAFVRKSMKPERYVSNPDRFEPMRGRLNQALLFAGLAIDHSGLLHEVTQARTISEARAGRRGGVRRRPVAAGRIAGGARTRLPSGGVLRGLRKLLRQFDVGSYNGH